MNLLTAQKENITVKNATPGMGHVNGTDLEIGIRANQLGCFLLKNSYARDR
jgi:hypothetical protein